MNSIYLFHISLYKVETWPELINAPLYIDEKWSVEDDHHVRAKIQFAAMQLLKRSLDGVFQILYFQKKGFQMQIEIFYEELYHAQPIVALKSVNWNRQRSFGAQCNFSSLTMKSQHLTEQLELENLSYFSKAKKNSDGWMQRVHTSIIFLLGFKNRGRG